MATDAKYVGLDNYGKEKQEFLNKLLALDDVALLKECEEFIWLSAYAGNNPRSDYHWQCDACYDEAVRRGQPGIYETAYKYVAENSR